jgi:hypothetical protein
MVWCPVGNKNKVADSITKEGFQVLKAKPVWENTF